MVTELKFRVQRSGFSVGTETGVKVMNTSYLRSYLRKQPETMDPAQVRRIIAALDDKCRTLEF